MHKITWIGTGVMGKPMAGYLAEAGYELKLYNRTTAKAEAAKESYGVDAKVEVFDNIKEAVQDSDIIFTIVGYPKDVEEVIAGTDGILDHAKPGAIVVDMTTSSPELAQKLYDLGQARSIEVMDAPVSGGDKGAIEGTLTIMAGGSKQSYDTVLPLLELMGTTINYMGPAGNGQHTKAANQIAIAGAISGMAETITYAVKAGLDPQLVLEVVGGGSASSWQMSNNGPKALAQDYAPGFFTKHFIKDMKLGQEEMAKRGVELPTLNTALETFEKFAADGHENDGTQGIIQYYLTDEELDEANK